MSLSYVQDDSLFYLELNREPNVDFDSRFNPYLHYEPGFGLNHQLSSRLQGGFGT